MESYETSSNGKAGNGAPNFGSRVDTIGSTAQQLLDEARGAVSDISRTLDLKGRVERNPYGTLLTAAAVGYVLGGGLFTPLTARILRLGIRMAALPLVKDELAGMAEAAFNGITGAADDNTQGRY